MKLNTSNEPNPKKPLTLLTAREQEVVAAAGGVAGGVVLKNPKAA